MSVCEKVFARLVTPLKILGILMLAVHFIYTGDFSFSLKWFLLYLIICGGSVLIFVVLTARSISMIWKRDAGGFDDDEMELARKLLDIWAMVKRNPWQILLIPGEDGLFFLPLLYTGINIYTAAVASLLFGLAHISYKPFSACLVNSATSFLVCLFVLPHGILAVLLGHLVVDLSVFAFMPFMKRKFDKKMAEFYSSDFDDEEWLDYDADDECYDYDEDDEIN